MSAPAGPEPTGPRRRPPRGALIALAVLVLGGCRTEPPAPARPASDLAGPTAQAPPAPAAKATAATPGGTGPIDRSAFAGSARCQPCHAEEHAAWRPSHHALAERPPGPAERSAFGAEVPGATTHRDGEAVSITASTATGSARYVVERVLGVAPLWQPVVRLADGRLQATEVAFDPVQKTWFLAFEAPRTPGEWGHWASRGMSWNTMCADCHNTGVDKGYDPSRDAYATVIVEHGVGCEACHGPAKAHVETPSTPVPLAKPTMETCAPCHSRRASLVPALRAEADLLDQAMLLTVGLDELYYPDGQIRDEVFGYASFRSSVMHEEDVTCSSCHDPHSGRLRRTGDALCLDCHATRPAFAAHDHHPPGTVGCVDCHMPQTTYMQRHPRRDHGLTVPDPALTVEYGIPNACNRCHTDHSPAWAAQHVERWYGAELAPRAQRARVLARLHRGDGGAVPAALKLLAGGQPPYWRAVTAGMLAPWSTQPPVRRALLPLLDDPDALVRAKAIEGLSPAAMQPAVRAALMARRSDPVRAVRVGAQRGVSRWVPPDDPAMADLVTYLEVHADQPQAALERGSWLVNHRRGREARGWLEKAARWDPHNGLVWHPLGLARGMDGDTPGAIAAFEEGTRRAPGNPRLWFALGAMRQQMGQAEAGRAALQRAAALGHPKARAMLQHGKP